MLIGRVTGRVVATTRAPGLSGEPGAKVRGNGGRVALGKAAR